MNKFLPHIPRYLLGLMFFVFGGIGLLNLVPPPPDMPADLATFMNGIMAAKYFFPLLKGTETLCGLLLLTGFAPALALVILAPITINILLVHLFLTPGIANLILPLIILALHLAAAYQYKNIYRPLFLRNN